ncbi:MAG TPA: hypothetical protein DCR14_19735 [Acidimicrobiaceae bacterium]|nr:hypothetical protein [Acidimicrobiaceae bacterium]
MPAPVPVRDATLGWAAAWVAGMLVASVIAAALGRTDESGDLVLSPGLLAITSLALWVPMVAIAQGLGRRHGAGNLVVDYAVRFRPVDLLGLPLGVVTQLVVVRALYWPLERVWPDTFSSERLEQRARELWESAEGVGVVVLVLVVAIGAPLVEELVYRGLLQGAFVRCLGPLTGVVLAAALFALIHFQPVEYPGLFVVGLVFGACIWRTGRLGMSIFTHIGFNATGLALVAAS